MIGQFAASGDACCHVLVNLVLLCYNIMSHFDYLLIEKKKQPWLNLGDIRADPEIQKEKGKRDQELLKKIATFSKRLRTAKRQGQVVQLSYLSTLRLAQMLV